VDILYFLDGFVMSAEQDQKLSKAVLIRKNMHQVLGILQEAKDKVRVASSLIIKHQGQLDSKLKLIDYTLESLKLLQDTIQKEFFNETR
jgi:ssDNA-binding replication factor A large subunit